MRANFADNPIKKPPLPNLLTSRQQVFNLCTGEGVDGSAASEGTTASNGRGRAIEGGLQCQMNTNLTHASSGWQVAVVPSEDSCTATTAVTTVRWRGWPHSDQSTICQASVREKRKGAMRGLRNK